MSSCAVITSDVTRFHSDGLMANKTFVLEPLAKQKGSLEFRSYAKIIQSKLISKGYTLATKKTNANYIIFFKYYIKGELNSVVASSLRSVDSKNRYSIPISTLTSDASSPYINSSFTIHRTSSSLDSPVAKVLELDIIDLKRSSKNHLFKVFEGKAITTNNLSTFSAVSNCLIDALFKNFPGKNGTVIVRIPADTCVDK